MNVRLPLILLALVLVPLLALLVQSLTSDPVDPADRLLQLAGSDPEAIAKEVDTVEIVRTQPAEEKLILTRPAGADKWDAVQPAGPKVDGFAVSGLVRDLVKLKPTAFAELTSNLTLHGLDKPTVRVTLRQGDKSATLNIGKTTIGKERAVTFVTTDARPDVPVAVRRADLDSLFKPNTGEGDAWQVSRWLPDFRTRRVFGADLRDPATDLAAIKITTGGKEAGLKRTDGGDWLFTAPASYGTADVAGSPDVVADTFTGVKPLLTAVTGFQVTDPADFLEAPGPLDQYGLGPNDPTAVRIELTPKVGKPETLILGKKVDEKAVPTKVFARVEGDPAVFRLATDRIPALTKLTADPTELRDRTLVSDQKRESIDAIDVMVGATPVKLRKVSVGTAKQWLLYGGPSDPQIAGPAAMALIDAVTRPRAAKEVLTVPADAAFAPADRKGEVKLWFNGVEEPKDAKPEPGKQPAEPTVKGDAAVTLLFGRVEGETGFVRRTIPGGPAVDLKVPEGLVKAAARDRLAFLDPKLKSFPTNTANRLAFARGGEAFEVTKDDKPDPAYPLGKWTYSKPDRLKGQIAEPTVVNNELLGLLATQIANGVAAENPTPEQLKQFGLAPPAQAVTVGLTGEPKEIGYEFGAETPDKQGVYAREAGKPLVLIVSPVTPQMFATADLRDRVLYRLTKADITGLTLEGWKPATGAATTIVLEKTPSGWAAKAAPAGWVPDGAKVDRLVDQLLAPRAEAYLGKELKAEHGFAGEGGSSPLVVGLLTGKPEPAVRLNVGNETAGGTSYFVWSSVPNEVVRLPAILLKPFKQSADALKK